MLSRAANLNLPYATLNLRRNPFGELEPDEWADLAVVEIDDVLAKLAQSRAVVQFVGEKGYGKTTHLLAVKRRFPTAGYVHIAEGQRGVIPSETPLLIDEAQRLTRWQQFRIFRSQTRLVLGTHRDFERQLRRAGRPVETIVVHRHTTTDRLLTLMNARIVRFRRSDRRVPEVGRDTICELQDVFGANIRGMLHELYLRLERLSQTCEQDSNASWHL